jgi:type II secretory pathway pseudopilin PulG
MTMENRESTRPPARIWVPCPEGAHSTLGPGIPQGLHSDGNQITGRPSEQGYLLVAVIFMLAIFVVTLAVAVPKVRDSIQRDRDLETMHRGKQYIRAIQLYYRKFNAYPPNVDALVKTNEIRFLRRKYIDPTTGKDEWKPVLFGQNKTPTAMGFFGQPLAGSTLAGIGPSGGNGLNGANGPQGNGLGNNTNGGAFGNSSNSGFGNNGNPGLGNNSNSGIGSNNGAAGATGSGTNGSAGTSGSGTNPDGSSSSSSGSSSAFGGPGNGQTGQTFGGAGIIGFSPGSPKQSIYVYKKKNHYNEWEFTYDPAQERMMLGGGGGNNGLGQPTPGAAVQGTPLTNTPTFGNPVATPQGGQVPPPPTPPQ